MPRLPYRRSSGSRYSHLARITNPTESCMARFSETAYEEIASYCIVHIRRICESFGPRPPGSEGERRCQDYLAGELSQAGLEPKLETFPVAQRMVSSTIF